MTCRLIYISQKDLGLELYDGPWTMFKELFIPTFFIVITVIQLHCFHKEFMELTRDEDVIPTSPISSSEETRRTTLPTLREENESLGEGTRDTIDDDNGSVGSVHDVISTQHETGSNNHIEVRIEMDKADVEPTTPVSVLKTPTKVASPSHSDAKSSIKSTRFVKSRPAVNKRSASWALSSPTSPGGLERSNSVESPTRQLGIQRRKTLAEIAPVNLEDLKSAATDIRVRATSLWDTAKPGINELYETCWRFLELHMIKFIYIGTFGVAVIQTDTEPKATAVNFVFVLFTSLALPLGRFEKLVMSIFGVWSAMLILAKMLYQLEISNYLASNYECSYVHFAPFTNGTPYHPFNSSDEVDYRTYLGFSQVSNVFPYIGKYLVILLLLTIHQVVTIRQKVYRYRYGSSVSQPKVGLLFPDFNSRKFADQGFINSLKFLLNYGFYKFGLEITILSIIILIGYRMDVMSVIFSIWLFILSLSRRKTVQFIWPFFTLFITVLIPTQYLLSLGLPRFLCVEYPWFMSLDPELRMWLYLPDFQISPVGSHIFYDFIVLLFASRQWVVFNVEKMMLPHGVGGGSNAETFDDGTDTRSLKDKDSVIPDFFTFGKTVLDHIKSLFFSGFYWVTLAVVFITATGKTNLFGLGYILGCFFFLWNGSEFYLKPIKTIVKTWKYMIAYCATVILLKTILQVSYTSLSPSLSQASHTN